MVILRLESQLIIHLSLLSLTFRFFNFLLCYMISYNNVQKMKMNHFAILIQLLYKIFSVCVIFRKVMVELNCIWTKLCYLFWRM